MKSNLKFTLLALLVVFTTIAANYARLTQQERQYNFAIPESKVNAFLMLMRGQLDQITAEELRSLDRTIEPQIFAQYKQYAQQDSAFNSYQKRLKDSTKKKMP